MKQLTEDRREMLAKLGYKESVNKPGLFYQEKGDIIGFIDFRDGKISGWQKGPEGHKSFVTRDVMILMGVDDKQGKLF